MQEASVGAGAVDAREVVLDLCVRSRWTQTRGRGGYKVTAPEDSTSS